HVRENGEHTPLKCSWCIAQSKWHSFVCKDSKGAGEGCFFLVSRIHYDLVISRITIKEAVVGMAS
ncbi:hypothetical protein PIB30_112067, partial [Stylosanthes scabra]|nr:hypothetical protein [Stylosanthes scabra]